jgi:tetratricopeptide (TPR) repeat protein
MHKTSLARAKVMNNEDINLELLYDYEQQNEMKIYDGRMRRCIGEILLNLGEQHFAESEKWVKKAIEADNTNGMMFYLGKDYVLYAEFLKRKGDKSKANDNLNKALEIFRECGAEGWVEKAEKEMQAIS